MMLAGSPSEGKKCGKRKKKKRGKGGEISSSGHQPGSGIHFFPSSGRLLSRKSNLYVMYLQDIFGICLM